MEDVHLFLKASRPIFLLVVKSRGLVYRNVQLADYWCGQIINACSEMSSSTKVAISLVRCPCRAILFIMFDIKVV
jgi:hypothetical protein